MRIKRNNALLLIVDFQERLMPSIRNGEEIIKRTEILISGCRCLNLPVIVTQQYTKGLKDTVEPIKKALEDFEYIDKISFSCCRNQEFSERLKALGRKDIIIAGAEAHICIKQTALDLLEQGYNLFAAVDCIGSRKEQDCYYGIRAIEKAGGVLSTTESILFDMMEDANDPCRKEISSLIK